MTENLHSLSVYIHNWAKNKGFEDTVERIHECITDCRRVELHEELDRLFSLAQVGLIVSELGELVEALRKPGKVDEHLPHLQPEQLEISDTIIRLLHLNSRIGRENLDDVLKEKLEYNNNRPYKHGKKL